jgi:hypothetical protein
VSFSYGFTGYDIEKAPIENAEEDMRLAVTSERLCSAGRSASARQSLSDEKGHAAMGAEGVCHKCKSADHYIAECPPTQCRRREQLECTKTSTESRTTIRSVSSAAGAARDRGEQRRTLHRRQQSEHRTSLHSPHVARSR